MTGAAGLTKLTVNLTPKAAAALNAAAERSGDTRTDTVNRALQVYDELTALQPGQASVLEGGMVLARQENQK